MPAYYDSMEMRRRHGMPANTLMAAYLEMVDTSRNVSKFWSCYVVGSLVQGYRIYYHWGRIGTEGQRRIDGPAEREAVMMKARSMIESKLHKGYAGSSFDHADLRTSPAVDEEFHEAGDETVHCQCGQPNCEMPRPDQSDTLRALSELARIDETVVSSHLAASGKKKQRRKTKTKQRPVQADRFILLEDDDDA